MSFKERLRPYVPKAVVDRAAVWTKTVRYSRHLGELREVLARGVPRDHQASDVGQTAVSGVGAVVSLPLTILGAPIKIIAGQ